MVFQFSGARDDNLPDSTHSNTRPIQPNPSQSNPTLIQNKHNFVVDRRYGNKSKKRVRKPPGATFKRVLPVNKHDDSRNSFAIALTVLDSETISTIRDIGIPVSERV